LCRACKKTLVVVKIYSVYADDSFTEGTVCRRNAASRTANVATKTNIRTCNVVIVLTIGTDCVAYCRTHSQIIRLKTNDCAGVAVADESTIAAITTCCA
jgi:hypothetical protein